ncbi:uncharacterized protein LOC131224177 [Magnolia sinica]|uniref:uncharacterized protein LOC131224177 n=1 Tax=Magnolia sinica TaxID=86752 RepID=UPI00265AFE5D|nr:uncharacterized protein LOC131224177 [Magnolia sinica]
MRGIGNSPSVRHVKQLISTHKPVIVILIEPMLSDSRRVSIGLKLSFHCSISNAASGGKIWIFHHTSLSVDSPSSSNQFLSFRVREPNLSLPLLVTCVYAKCSYMRRRELWADLVNQSATLPGPWIVCGDFNAVTAHSERIGGNSLADPSSSEFIEAINQVNLTDAGFFGSAFTWCNNCSGSNRKWARLDRVLCSPSWVYTFPSCVQHLTRICSDHSPLLLSAPPTSPTSPKSFHFQRMWIQHDGFQTMVSNAWKSNTFITPMIHLLIKMRNTKEALTRWNKESFGNIFSQIKLSSGWLLEGDRNSKFFHASTTDQVRRAQIKHIVLQDGSITFDQAQMRDVAAAFFKTLYSAEVMTHSDDSTNIIPSLVSQADNDFLLAPVSIEEVNLVVLALPADGAPGLDGFSGSFFASCWNIVALDLHRAVNYLFQGGTLPRAFSATLLCLIPKCVAPKSFSDFRPISLRNYVYKIFF